MNFAVIGSMLISQAASAASSRWSNIPGRYAHLECRPWAEIQEEREIEEVERFINEVEVELDREENARKYNNPYSS